MEVTVTDINSVKKSVRVQIPQADVARELDAAYAELKKKAKIKGFRPGKAPRAVLEKLYAKEVNLEIQNTLIQNSLTKAAKEHNLDVIGMPQLDPPELNPEAPYAYEITVEVKPALAPIQFRGVSLKKNVYKASDIEVDKQIELLRKKLAEFTPIEENRPAAMGDYIMIDYEGTKDGQAFAQTQKTENYTLKIGQKMITEAFDGEMIGMTPGRTKTFPLTFPEDYHNKDLAGVTVAFTVTLKEIRKEVLPAADDDFARKLGNYENLQALRSAIRDHLQEGYDKRGNQELQERVFEALLTEDFDIPDIYVKMELDGIVADMEARFSENNMTLDQLGLTREKLEDEYRDVAEKQVRRHLFLNKIIEQEQLTLTDQEMAIEYAAFARALGQPVDALKQYYKSNPDKLEAFKHALLEKKAFDLIFKNAVIEEVACESVPG